MSKSSTNTTWLPGRFTQSSRDGAFEQSVRVVAGVISGVVDVNVRRGFGHCDVRLSPADAREVAMALRQMADAVEKTEDDKAGDEPIGRS